MNVAVYTLTRDRLDYTKVCFESLKENAGYPYDHYVLDNGSEDETPNWITWGYPERFYFTRMTRNVGISRGSNILLDEIFHQKSKGQERIPPINQYDLIIKMDNDCLLKHKNTIKDLVEIYSERPFKAQHILSPRVDGIVNQPHRGRSTQMAGRPVGYTAIVGGLFHCVPAAVYAQYRYPENIPLAHGQDDHFCNWAKSKGAEVGYVESIVVEHFRTTNGQAEDYPEYFKRKWIEEKTLPS